MELEKIFEILLYAVPALITGIIAFYFFKEHTKNEDGRRRYLLHKDIQVSTLPIRLQAYERMALFLERITPSKLLIRISPTSSDKNSYESLLISSIEQEFEHNLAQQIYISEKCWSVIIAAKNATSQIVKKTSEDFTITNAQELRESILKRMLNNAPPSDTALAFIKV